MVATNEEIMARREKPEKGELSELDWAIIGKEATRLELPLENPSRYRQMAELLRGFAASLEFAGQRQDIPLRLNILSIKQEAKAINARMRRVRGVGRPRKEDA